MTLFEIRKLAHVDVPSWHHFQVDAICAIHLEVHDRYVAYGYSSPGAGAYLDRLKEEWHATAGERYVQICLALSHDRDATLLDLLQHREPDVRQAAMLATAAV